MKSLVQFIREQEEPEQITIKNLEVTYTTKSENLLVQVPDNYNEDNISLYLDDTCMKNMPSEQDNAIELFGEENAQHITDAYFEYENLTVPVDATEEPDIEWNKRYDNNVDRSAKLMVYSLDGFTYKIVFDEFVISDMMNKNLNNILKDIFTSAEGNHENHWEIDIKLKDITFDK